MSRRLPLKPNLEYLKSEAKDLLEAHATRDPQACEILKLLRQFAGMAPDRILDTPIALADAQFALALDYQFSGWKEMTDHVAAWKEGKIMTDENRTVADELTRDLDAELERKAVSQRKAEELIPLMVAFSRVARRHGLLGLDKVPERIDEEFLRMGLRWVVDGTDRSVVDDILTVKKKTLLAAYERRLDMMIAGCQAVQEGLNPRFVEEKCRAML